MILGFRVLGFFSVDLLFLFVDSHGYSRCTSTANIPSYMCEQHVSLEGMKGLKDKEETKSKEMGVST